MENFRRRRIQRYVSRLLLELLQCLVVAFVLVRAVPLQLFEVIVEVTVKMLSPFYGGVLQPRHSRDLVRPWYFRLRSGLHEGYECR